MNAELRIATAIEQDVIVRALERLAESQAAAAVPEVEATLLRGQFTDYFVVEKCPFCQRRHIHGAVEGTRVSHCAAGGTYRLRWDGKEMDSHV
jgi:hypothetical protein